MKASCQCGALRAFIDDAAEPYVVACHCRDCRKRTGAPFGAIAYFPVGAVRIEGEMREFTRLTDAGSSFTNGFCPSCGTSLHGSASRMPGIAGIALGCLDGMDMPVPVRSVYEQGRCGWVELLGTMSHHQQGRDT